MDRVAYETFGRATDDLEVRVIVLAGAGSLPRRLGTAN